jgi:DNA-binding transcriptional ArsR family regulator
MDEKFEQEIIMLHNRVCSGVGDPKRVLILYELEKASRCVNDLSKQLGMSQPAVSRHLRVLRERNLVLTDRQGASVYYKLADHRLIEALNLLRGVLASQLAAEREIAESMQ